MLVWVDSLTQALSLSGNTFGFESSFDRATGRARASATLSLFKRTADEIAEALFGDFTVPMLGAVVGGVDIENAVFVYAVSEPSNDLILLKVIEDRGIARRPMQRNFGAGGIEVLTARTAGSACAKPQFVFGNF